jgi:large subunit ribosomal protein L10
MAKPEKVNAVKELTAAFTDSTAAVLTEYRGLKVAQLTNLRKSLGSDTTYSIVKNTLTQRAVHDAGLDELSEMLVGPTAVAFVNGDPVLAAKGLRDFARTNPALVIKGGVLDGKTLSADEINRIADLDTREVLLAKLAGAMKANLSKAAAVFQAPLSQMARLAEALKEKKTADEPTEAPAEASVVAADAPAEDAAGTDQSAVAEAPAPS